MPTKTELYTVAVHEAGHAVAALYLGFALRWLQIEPKPLTRIATPRKGNPSIIVRRLLAIYLAGIEAERQVLGRPWPDESEQTKDVNDFWKMIIDHHGREFARKLAGYPHLNEQTYPLASNLAKKVVYTNRNRIINLARALALSGGGRLYGEYAQKIAWRAKEQEPPECADLHVLQSSREWTLNNAPWPAEQDCFTDETPEPPEPPKSDDADETESKWQPWPESKWHRWPSEPKPITASEAERLGLSIREVTVEGSQVRTVYRDSNGMTRVAVEPVYAGEKK